MSSPGTNIFMIAFLSIFFNTRYYVQDTFPEGKLLALGLERFIIIFKPLLTLCYRNIDELFTISKSMQQYLESEFKIKCQVIYNPSNTQNVQRNVSYDSRTFLFSGNFSFAHGYQLPKKVFKQIVNLNFDLKICGFGKNFDKLKNSGELPDAIFNGFMVKSAEKELETTAVFILLQKEGFEKYCFTSKFTSLSELPNAKFLFVGPDCDISEIIKSKQNGVHIKQGDSNLHIQKKLNSLFDV